MPDADPITENPDFYQHTHRLMARLRAESPVHRVRMGPDGDGWLVTRYADVKAASAAPEVGRDLATIRKLERAHAGDQGAATDDDRTTRR